jgi:hypothetical protein
MRSKIFAFVILLPACLLADTLEFQNGDRLKGQYLRTEDTAIFFRSEAVGEIKVPAQDVVLKKEGLSSASESIPSIAEPVVKTDTEIALAQDEFQSNEVIDTIYQVLTFFVPLKDWKPVVSFGYNWQSGEVRNQDWIYRFVASVKSDTHDIRLDARYDYGTVERVRGVKEKTRDLLRFEGRYRLNMDDRFFFQDNVVYTKDKIKGIRNACDNSVGIGWRYLKGDRWNGSVTPSMTSRFQENYGDNEKWNFLYTLFQDLSFKVNEGLTLREEAKASFDVDKGDKANYEFDGRLEQRISKHFVLEIGYQYEFDYTLDVGVEGKIQRVYTRVAFEF